MEFPVKKLAQRGFSVEFFWFSRPVEGVVRFGEKRKVTDFVRIDGKSCRAFLQDPVDIVVDRRNQRYDILQAGLQIFFSNRIVDRLKSIDATGFELREVETKYLGGVDPGNVRNFYEFVVTGWGGFASEESGIRLLDKGNDDSGPCWSMYTDKTKVVDESQWDGSDFFKVWPLVGIRIVTRRIRDLFSQSEFLPSDVFLPLNRLDCEKGETTFRPGFLRQTFPERRAREVGIPLGIF